MEMSHITPDTIILFRYGPFAVNATVFFTWLVMIAMVLGSWLATRKVSCHLPMSRWQNLLEVVVGGIREQIRGVSRQDPERYVPFIGSLFLFIAVSNLLGIVPGYIAPTGSLSTTVALALCTLVAVPFFGIRSRGLGGYLRHYARPSIFMLPFNLIGELSRTLALAVRLFGNVMSGAKIAAILLAIAPLFMPILMHALGLLTGLIQAYIFATLAMVYIASAIRAQQERSERLEKQST